MELPQFEICSIGENGEFIPKETQFKRITPLYDINWHACFYGDHSEEYKRYTLIAGETVEKLVKKDDIPKSIDDKFFFPKNIKYAPCNGEVFKISRPPYFNRKFISVEIFSEISFGFDSKDQTDQYFNQLEEKLGAYLEVIREDDEALTLRSKDKTKYLIEFNSNLIEFNSRMYSVLARI